MKKEMCRNCLFYNAYYLKRSSCFSRINHGHCSKHYKETIQHDCCENYKSNEIKVKKYYQFLLSSLEDSLKSISEISQILKEHEQD